MLFNIEKIASLDKVKTASLSGRHYHELCYFT